MPSPAPQHIPESFFSDSVRGPGRPKGTTDPRLLPSPLPSSNGWQPQKAMFWYDSIIDDMFANPGTTYKDTAARLGRSPVTIGMIVRSDLFKARYVQRRDQFNEDLDARLTGKLAKVAETALDLTLEKLEKTRTNVPLPLLHDIATKSLDRLGYGVQSGPGVQVNVQQNNNTTSITAPVSAEALAAARQNLRTIENSRLIEGRVAAPLPSAQIEDSSRSDPRPVSLVAPTEEPEPQGSVAAGAGEGSEGAL